MEELIKYYKEDLLDSNFLDYVENYPIGVIQVNYELPSEYNSNYTLYWEYPIFENYTKVIQCLAEHELISEKLKPEGTCRLTAGFG